MKKLSLTQNQFALVDDEDFEWLSQWKWQARWEKKTKSFYAIRTDRQNVPRKTILMHRLIMNTPEGMVTDHINHNTLDNQRSNLRNATNSQNLMNRKSPLRRSLTGHLGVQPHGNGYRAFIRVDGKHKNFPVRHTIDDAIRDRREAEIQHYGEFRGNVSGGLINTWGEKE